MRRKGTVEQLAEQRARGLLLTKQGKKAKEVAEILNVTSRTVNRWLQQARKPGRKRKPKPIGRHRKLTEVQVKRLAKALKRGAPSYGYFGDYWTLDRIGQVIWQLFSIRCHPSTVWYILGRMGWSCQRPQRRAFQRDEKAIAQWTDEVQPEIKKEVRS